MTDLRTGKPDAKPDDPRHIKGIKQGNSKGNYERQPGHRPDGRSTSQRSTGIDAKRREPIDPRMPNLSPA
jgi:hypothetical protein